MIDSRRSHRSSPAVLADVVVEGAGFRLEEAIQRAPYDTESPTQRLYVRAFVL